MARVLCNFIFFVTLLAGVMGFMTGGLLVGVLATAVTFFCCLLSTFFFGVYLGATA